MTVQDQAVLTALLLIFCDVSKVSFGYIYPCKSMGTNIKVWFYNLDISLDQVWINAHACITWQLVTINAFTKIWDLWMLLSMFTLDTADYDCVTSNVHFFSERNIKEISLSCDWVSPCVAAEHHVRYQMKL